jgi:hypothetical protein
VPPMRPAKRRSQVLKCASLGLSAALWSLLPTRAHASETVRVELRPSARAEASQCVPPARLQVETEAHLRRQVFSRNLHVADVRLDIDVVDATQQVHLLLHELPTGASLGRRDLQAASCDELEASTVLALTLMLDFTRDDLPARRAAAEVADAKAKADADAKARADAEVKATQAAEPSTPAQSPTTATTEQTPRASGEPTATDRKRSSLGIVLDARGGLGLLPTVDLGLAASVGLDLSQRLRAEMGVVGWWPQTIERLGGQISITRGSLQGAVYAWVWSRRQNTVRVGVSGLLDATNVQGEGFDQNRTQLVWLTELGAVAVLDHALSSRSFLRLGVFAFAPVPRAEFIVSSTRGADVAFSMAPLSGGISLGFGLGCSQSHGCRP